MAVVGIYSLLLARNKILLIRVFESNTVNNMKLMILEKIRVIHTCSSSPRAASVFNRDILTAIQLWKYLSTFYSTVTAHCQKMHLSVQ
jgi:hypothetical protein